MVFELILKPLCNISQPVFDCVIVQKRTLYIILCLPKFPRTLQNRKIFHVLCTVSKRQDRVADTHAKHMTEDERYSLRRVQEVMQKREKVEKAEKNLNFAILTNDNDKVRGLENEIHNVLRDISMSSRQLFLKKRLFC